MSPQLLKTLYHKLLTTVSTHKKKLLVTAILLVAFGLIRRKINEVGVMPLVMFLIKFWGKVMTILPMPTFAKYRFMPEFRIVPVQPLPQIVDQIDIAKLLAKIKNREPNALQELKSTVMSGVVLDMVLYNAASVYEMVKNKYSEDFKELGAGAQFEDAMQELQSAFLRNLDSYRHYIVSELYEEIKAIQLSSCVNEQQIQQLFRSLIAKLYSSTQNIGCKIICRQPQQNTTKQYKIADNLFRTTKEYIQEQPPSLLTRTARAMLSPATWLLGRIFAQPETSLTEERFTLNQFLYVLPLKKHRHGVVWKTTASEHLYGMVVDELVNFFYSVNFNVVSYRKAELNLEIFMNRVRIYFMKKANSDRKKLMELIPVFYKIVKEQLSSTETRKKFYDKQLFASFKESSCADTSTPMSQLRLRNRILLEIYNNNRLEALERDMQAKFHNERQGLTIQPLAANPDKLEDKDEMEQFISIFNNADTQKDTTAEQLQMMREMIQ